MDKFKEVQDTLEYIRPYVRRDGGDIQLVKVEEDIAYLKFGGACIDCGVSDLTIDGIKEYLQDSLSFLEDVIIS